eukprot:TRINITY_DN27799_c0_g1_i1.p1 TRINITY_DN27799_c0_g1~~TRINITY_DN27799_c0_g1_i1.p1  ORF type:complete len:290 (-),score=37.59 TRINITY_DN27799_c0_g1_i1:180-935(-)
MGGVEEDMAPWVCLEPPTRAQNFNRWKFDGTPEASGDRYIASSSPDMHYNVGCHEESEDEEPYADYNSGCRTVEFHTCSVSDVRGFSRAMQIIRASRFADSFDRSGRHWIYVLPSSPLEPLTGRLFPIEVPRPLLCRIWELAVSWPKSARHFPEMKIHPSWPFNMLRIRRKSEATSEVVATVPSSDFEDTHFSIDTAASGGVFWKLAPGMKDFLRDNGFLRDDFDESSEGFVTKTYSHEGATEAHQTLSLV